MPSNRLATVRTRICIISDTHTACPNLPPSDLLIHCGDLTQVGRPDELESQLRYLTAAPAPIKLVIPGNHDIIFDRPYYARKGSEMHGRNNVLDDSRLDEIHDMWCNSQASGLSFLDKEGLSNHFLDNGASVRVYSSAWQPEFCDWAFGYPRDADRFNLHSSDERRTVTKAAENPIPDHPSVDIMITHGPPLGILDTIHDGQDVGCAHLRRALARARPLIHCFGHIHEGWGCGTMSWSAGDVESDGVFERYDESKWHVCQGNLGHMDEESYSTADHVYLDATDLREKDNAGRGQSTLVVNAAHMDVDYNPVNLPWLIDIDLPVGQCK